LVVSNTTPLVYLAALGDFEFLRELFGQIAIPRAVHREIAVGGIDLPVARAVEAAMTSWLFVKEGG
jgi:predicted nucleic acid-binding protein